MIVLREVGVDYLVLQRCRCEREHATYFNRPLYIHIRHYIL
jgi:hypothetical protein